MRCTHSRKKAKEYYEDNYDRYYEEKEAAFRELIINALDAYLDGKEDLSTEDFCDTIDSFSFKDQDDWLSDEYEGFLGDCADRAYDEYRDDLLTKDD